MLGRTYFSFSKYSAGRVGICSYLSGLGAILVDGWWLERPRFGSYFQCINKTKISELFVRKILFSCLSQRPNVYSVFEGVPRYTYLTDWCEHGWLLLGKGIVTWKLTSMGGWHSSVVLSVPTIQRPRVCIPCTPFTLFSTFIVEIGTVFAIGMRKRRK